MFENSLNPRCPYCRYELEKMPKRKVECRHCGQPIYVRSHSFFDSVLVTGAQATVIGYIEKLRFYHWTSSNDELEVLKTQLYKTRNDTDKLRETMIDGLLRLSKLTESPENIL